MYCEVCLSVMNLHSLLVTSQIIIPYSKSLTGCVPKKKLLETYTKLWEDLQECYNSR